MRATNALADSVPRAARWATLVQTRGGRAGLSTSTPVAKIRGGDSSNLAYIDPLVQTVGTGDRIWRPPDPGLVTWPC